MGQKYTVFPSIIFQGLLSGLFEVFGLCFFTVVILMETDIPPGLRIIMTNGVFVFPVLWQAYKRRPCGQDQNSWKQFVAFTLALILEIAGVGVLMYLVSIHYLFYLFLYSQVIRKYKVYIDES